VFTKILATIGTIMVWSPIVFLIFISLIVLITRHVFRFDYLIPAELFPVELIGGGLLLWASFRARVHKKLIAGGLSITVLSLVCGQAFAVITGLASGETRPGGWQWSLVITLIAIYTLTLIAIGTGGILLLRDIFCTHQSTEKKWK
jgi:hypothetical protein